MLKNLFLLTAIVLTAALGLNALFIAPSDTSVAVLYLVVVILATKLPKRRHAELAAAAWTVWVVIIAYYKVALALTPLPAGLVIFDSTLIIAALWQATVFAYLPKGNNPRLIIAAILLFLVGEILIGVFMVPGTLVGAFQVLAVL